MLKYIAREQPTCGVPLLDQLDHQDMSEKILLVEDKQELGMTLSELLRSQGYVVEVASDAARALEKATTRPCDLIILDATVSGRSRIEVCRDIREAGLKSPVLVLTPHGETTHRVLGLKLGADDCVTEPFEVSELLARVEALLRRRYLRTLGSVHRFGAVHIDIPAGKVIREGKPVSLPLREFKLLCYFVEHAGIPLARDELLREVWGYGGGTSTRTVDVHVTGLRRKLEKNPKRPELILTVVGVGYQFGRGMAERLTISSNPARGLRRKNLLPSDRSLRPSRKSC